MDSGVLSDLVETAYSAAFEDGLWPEWSRKLSQELGGAGGTFFVLDEGRAAVDNVVHYWGQVETLSDEYFDGWCASDPQLAMALSLRRTSVYVDTDYIDLGIPSVANFMKWQRARGSIEHHMSAVALLGGGTRRAGISIHRSLEAGCTPAAEREKLASLLPEIDRAFQLAFRLSELLQSALWEGVVVGDGDKSAFLLDERGRVIRHTDAAGRLIAAADGLAIVGATLRADCKESHDALRVAVGRSTRKIEPQGGIARLRRPSGRRSLIATCYPLT